MTRPEALLHHTANLLVGGTGLVYGWMLYLATPEDEFALVNHAWQPQLHTLHLLLAPVLLFAIGLSWQSHVWMRLRFNYLHKRKTGLLLTALVLPMVISGYAIQVCVSESLRTAWIWIHGVSSVLWLLTYGVHLALPDPPHEDPWGDPT